MDHPGITIGETFIAAGNRDTIELPSAGLYSHTPVPIPVHVICGKRQGPCLFVSGAIHGDEIIGVEIIRRLLRQPLLKQLRGTLLAVPVVNVYGFINRSRYLPDRRDLNRSFPGSDRGSMAARLADLFLNEIMDKSDYGIDIHSGAVHRENLPHIRADLDDPATADLARVFDVPLILNSDARDGSLREEAAERKVPLILYEAGEALRLDERSIRAGLKGTLSVMRKLGMLPYPGGKQARKPNPAIAQSSSWIRAPESGLLKTTIALGARVKEGDRIGIIIDPFGEAEFDVTAHLDGIIIGRSNLPLVNEGEALFHIATFDSPGKAERAIEAFHAEAIPAEPLLDPLPPGQ